MMTAFNQSTTATPVIIGKRVTIGEKAGVEYAIEVFKWTAHEDGNCWVCRGKAGRPKKSTKKRGRPKQESCKGIANTVLKNAPKSLKALQPLSLADLVPSSHLASDSC